MVTVREIHNALHNSPDHSLSKGRDSVTLGKGLDSGKTSDLLIEFDTNRASSSVVEQGTFNPRVVGSIPTWLTADAASAYPLCARDDLLNSRGRDRQVVGPDRLASPHRLEAQDTALSRRRHGFESRWGHTGGGPRAISSGVERLPYKEEVAGSNPASPTLESGLYKPLQ